MNGHYQNFKMDVAPPAVLLKEFHVPNKLLMGAGPANLAPRVAKMCSAPILGILQTDLYKILDEVKEGLKYAFQTTNEWTFPITGSGHMGMEAMLFNLLEPGERVLIGMNGFWAIRLKDMAHRLDLDVCTMQTPMGKIYTMENIEQHLQKYKPKVFILVQSESTTGVLERVEGVGDLCRKYDCLLVVDTVASLGAVPFFMDKWKVDAVYSGSQKGLGAPPGFSPLSFGPRAVNAIKHRKSPVKSYMMDAFELSKYWGCNGEPYHLRMYHHTPPVSILYALREALSILAEETLEKSWERHAIIAKKMHAGLAALGLEFYTEKEEDRLPIVSVMKVPDGLDARNIIQYGLQNHLLEIAGGLGELKGKVIRIGTMAANATPEIADRVLQVLREGLAFAREEAKKPVPY